MLSLLLLSALAVGAPAPAPAPVSPAPNLTESASAPQFDFDLGAPVLAPVTPAFADPKALALEKQVHKRRTMLKAHQVLGLSTLGLMATTVVLGQLNYTDLYGRHGGRTGNYLMPHRIFAYTTTGSFLVTASFSLFAPTPIRKVHQGFDTSIIHKASVAVASAGMVTQIVLGFITARSADAGNADHLARWSKVHQAVGYTTLGALTTAAVVWVF